MLQEDSSLKQVSNLYHLYDTYDQMASKLKHKTQIEFSLPTKIQSDQSISQIYTYINQIIYNFKLNSQKQYKEVTQWKQRSYYLFKSKLFFKFYSSQKIATNEASQNLHVFIVNNLHLVFMEILRIRDEIKPLIYKLYGQEIRNTKIDGFFLISSIDSLLKEIINAAFPYELYSNQNNSIQLFSQSINLTPQQIEFIKNERQEGKDKFIYLQMQSLKNSLLQVDDSIQSLKIKQKKINEGNSKGLKDEKSKLDEQLMKSKIQKLQFTKFKNKIFLAINIYINKPILHTIDYFQKIIKEEPTNNHKYFIINNIERYISKESLKFTNYFLFWKNLIQVFGNLKIQNQQQYESCLLQMVHIVQNWIDICKECKDISILIQNYIVLLRMYSKINPRYIIDQQTKLFSSFEAYINNLITFLIHQNQAIMNKIIATDQQFTYAILTTKQIIKTLVGFQDTFNQLIKEFAPILQILIQLTSISQNTANKHNFIETVISKIHYPSQKNQRIKTKAKLYSVISHIEELLNFNHEQIKSIKPYLREMKSTLILLALMKKNQNNKKRNQEAQQYEKLKEISSYFYKQRETCPIYELKSKILLFITLFIMGYHHPVIKEGEKTVNLRNRIINLYNRLYSQSVQNLLMSLIQSVDSKSSSVQYQEYDYNSEMLYLIDPKAINIIIGHEKDVFEQICGSQQLSTNINNFITNNFVSNKENGRTYLINLMNTLQYELFIFEQNSIQRKASSLSTNYSSYLKKCLGVQKNTNDPHILKLLEVQNQFFLHKYQKAWRIFMEYKLNNKQFISFIEDINMHYYNTSLLKFLAIYNMFEKMQHQFYNKNDKQQNITELYQKINLDAKFQFQRQLIQQLYYLKQKENRSIQLQQFYNERLKANTLNQKYEQMKSQLNFLNIKVLKSQDRQTQKKTIAIQIGQQHKNHYQRLLEQLIQYYLFNQIGMYKARQVKLSNSLIIILQSNNYSLENQVNVFQTYQNAFEENTYEKFCRKCLQTTIQCLQTFYNNSISSSSLLVEQFDIDFKSQSLSFCLNPFYGLILSILKPTQQSHFYKNKDVNNRKIIQQLFYQIANQLSQSFRNNYYYFLSCLTKIPNSKNILNYNKLLQMPLFMKLQQKQTFFVSFHTKLEKMYDKIHKDQQKLIKKKDFFEAQRKRLAYMKESIYKNYSYHFIIGGIIQLKMNYAKIVSQAESNRFDWISQHKHLIEYDLPKNPNSKQIKQSTYSINYFLKYLNGVIASKRQGSYDIILNICSQFPKLIDFLYKNKGILQSKFQEVMINKNAWILQYFNLSEIQLKKIKSILYGNAVDLEQMNEDTQQSIRILRQHKKKYETKLINNFKTKNYNCPKCADLIQSFKKCPLFIDFLTKLRFEIMKNSNLLIFDHSSKQCFLMESFKNHRIISILGGWSKKLEAKNYLVINWWFYLQGQFPLLIESFDSIRHLLVP